LATPLAFKVPNGEEKLLKIYTGGVGWTNVTGNKTDGRAKAYSERDFTLAKSFRLDGKANLKSAISGNVLIFSISDILWRLEAECSQLLPAAGSTDRRERLIAGCIVVCCPNIGQCDCY